MADANDRITPATPKRDTLAETTPGARTPARRASGNGRPTDPEAMRQEIVRTRARLSRTLDELEHRIVSERRALERTKEDLWDRVTLQGFRRKLSSEPWRSVGIAFLVGYIVAAIRD